MSNANDELVAQQRLRECEDAWDRMLKPEEVEPTTCLDFGQALAAMREGKRVRRASHRQAYWWTLSASGNGFSQHWRSIKLSVTPSPQDILATDWEVVE